MVFDGTSDELREGCVRVAAGVIVEVGEGPKAGNRVIDCRDRAVIPGLIDAHFHAYGASLSLLEIETSSLSYLALAGGEAAGWRAGDPRPPELGCCLGGGHMAEVVDGVDALRRAARERLRSGAHASAMASYVDPGPSAA